VVDTVDVGWFLGDIESQPQNLMLRCSSVSYVPNDVAILWLTSLQFVEYWASTLYVGEIF
jgi:hypothetical protein